jgi:hypothetical protein
MRTKIPVVSGHVTSALKSEASFRRNSLTVANLPFGILRISSSTSFAVGMSIDPLPNRAIFGGTGTTFGSCGFSNFARQGLRLVNSVFIPMGPSDFCCHVLQLLRFAEEGNSSNASRTSIQTLREIINYDAAQRQHRKIGQLASYIL